VHVLIALDFHNQGEYFPNNMLAFIVQKHCVSCDGGTEVVSTVHSNFVLQIFPDRLRELIRTSSVVKFPQKLIVIDKNRTKL
jgi:hypothetical protein